MTWLFVTAGIVTLFGISAFFGAPYVPSRRRDVRRMFTHLRPLTASDVLLDIGSGDGLVLRAARARGAKAIGYEIHPVFALVSRVLSLGDKRVAIRWANAWTAPFPSDVTLIYIFSVGRDGKRVVRKMQREVECLCRPIELICYGNPLPGRTPARTFEAYYLYEFRPLHPQEA